MCARLSTAASWLTISVAPLSPVQPAPSPRSGVYCRIPEVDARAWRQVAVIGPAGAGMTADCRGEDGVWTRPSADPGGLITNV